MKDLIYGLLDASSEKNLPFSSLFVRLNKIIIKRSLKMQLPRSIPESQNLKILAICCYMADRTNLVEELVKSVESSKQNQINLVISNNTDSPPSAVVKPYIKYTMPKTPKFNAVAQILKEQFSPFYDYVIIMDDDVNLPNAFFDKYFRVVKGLGLILSQPSLTRDSFGFHRFCYQIDGAIAHLVSFVEIGPVTCFEKRLVPLLNLDGSPMGWGLDFVWARICRDRRWPMGVIDLVSVQHTLREVAKSYDKENENDIMDEYLSKRQHMPAYVRDIIGQIIMKKQYPEIN